MKKETSIRLFVLAAVAFASVSCGGDNQSTSNSEEMTDIPAEQTEAVADTTQPESNAVLSGDTLSTSSGLQYIILKNGNGDFPKPGQTVSVHYTGTLTNGSKFDSSVDRGQPISFTLGKGEVIRGWDEGIGMLDKGAKARLIIPHELGYGERGMPPVIPPSSTLIFDVELVDFK